MNKRTAAAFGAVPATPGVIGLIWPWVEKIKTVGELVTSDSFLWKMSGGIQSTPWWAFFALFCIGLGWTLLVLMKYEPAEFRESEMRWDNRQRVYFKLNPKENENPGPFCNLCTKALGKNIALNREHWVGDGEIPVPGGYSNIWRCPNCKNWVPDLTNVAEGGSPQISRPKLSSPQPPAYATGVDDYDPRI